MTAQEYFSHPGISKSSLDDFARCAAHYHAVHIAKTVKRETTPAMQFGSLLHGLVLEGRADYHTKPDGMTFASKEGKAWKEAHLDKPILSAADAADLQTMSSAILRHPHAAPLFGKGKPEVALFGQHKASGLPIKGRLDWLAERHVVDIKTTADASDKGIIGSMKSYRYWLQAAYYLRLAQQNGFNCFDFYFVFIERGGLINIWQMSQTDIDCGNIVMDAELERLADCIEADEWPDYAAAKPTPKILPPYVFPAATAELTGAEEVQTETKPTEGDLIP